MADRQLTDIFSNEVFTEAGIQVLYSGDPGAPILGDRRYTVVTGIIERYNGLTWDFIGTGVEFITVTPSGDDKGLNIAAELSVGSPAEPHETVLGEGDSYPVNIAFHCDTATTTGLTITGATNVTTELQSDSGSTVGLFGGTAAGKYLLIGADYPFGGAKVKMDTIGVVEPANVIGEYLKDSAPTWATSPYMVTNADFPYEQKGYEIASCSSCSEQWRFGFDPDDLPTTWAKVTLNINGTDYEKYWGRFRITSAITTDPTVEQLKQHTNRWECNADGNTEYFGRARYPKDLTMHWGLTNQLQGFAPQNENIDFATDLSLVYIGNKFANGQTDGRGGFFVVPTGLDTSIPVTMEVLWEPLDNTAGNVAYEIDIAPKKVGELMDTADTPTTISGVETIAVNESNVLKRTRIKFFINTLVPGDVIGLGLKRLGGDVTDTYGGPVALINVRLIGYFWRP